MSIHSLEVIEYKYFTCRVFFPSHILLQRPVIHIEQQDIINIFGFVFLSQLLTDPPILICDEPTTGLDSYTANNVIGLLRQLSSRGKAVLCSVHQPASGIFEMFDTVSLLVSGGRLAYFGEVNGAKKYFAE